MCDKDTKISIPKSDNLTSNKQNSIKRKDSIIYEYAFKISPPIKDINIQLTA